ncbi:caspase family protein [Pannus brasiliensis CCIBt3594]|uniref:Caspase family protein n=1 Tax=Pannus brasiliensis CCIBt3594 TaxID=1427578 RepID=A0AAW9QTJ1_9CHRO
MKVTRREFLRGTGMSLFALGVSSLTLDRHLRVLATPAPRKLALLVGIDRYGSELLDLEGCATDVELQKLLLQYRFGFLPEDILTLTGENATRQAIETAFREHLIDRAKPEDVVVFHFSGRGARVGSAPPRDCLIPFDGPDNPILLDSLLLLARCLPTERSTLVLDTGFAPSETTEVGNLRSRSYPGGNRPLDLAEFTLQEDIKQRYQPKNSLFSGVLVTATGKDGIAVEIGGNGWSAGLFTYSLTRALWTAIPAPATAIVLKRVGESIESLMGAGREPLFTNGGKSELLYHIPPEKSIGGEAILTRLIDDRAIELTLTGLPLEVLENYGIDSRLVGRGADGEEIAVALLSRQGLTARAKLLSPGNSPAVGQIFREKRRVFSGKIGLIVALDSELSRIERVDAIGAFASLPTVAAVINAGERQVDCLLSRDGTEQSGSYRLLSPNGSLILGSLGAGNEAVKSGVKRLEPLLETLLARKLWRLLVNGESSGVAAVVRLETAGKLPLARQDTRAALLKNCFAGATADCPPASLRESENPARLSIGTEIRYRIENQGEEPLYGLILGIDNELHPLIVCDCRKNDENPGSPTRKFTPFVVGPGERTIVPDSSGGSMKVTAPSGIVEHYVILSRKPLEKTLVTLNSAPTVAGTSESFFPLREPLEVTRALWEDTRSATEVTTDTAAGAIDNAVFDVGTWAAFRFIYRALPLSPSAG